MSKYQALIFDLDGVIIDSESLRIHTYKVLFKESFSIDIKINKNDFVGNSEESNLSYIIKQYSLVADIALLIEKRKTLLNDLAKNEILFNVPVINLLILAKKMNLLTAVCTNSHRDYLQIILDRLSGIASVDIALSREDIRKPKPDPEIYQKASFMLDVKPEKCLVFEDSKPGREAAKIANMDVIIVPEDVASTFITIDSLSGA